MQYGLQSIWGNAYYFDPNSGAEIFNQNINLGYGTAYFGGDGVVCKVCYLISHIMSQLKSRSS